MLKTKNPFSAGILTTLDFVLAGLVFIFSLVLYVRTLAPSLVYEDGAEFQTLAYTLGMTHPTGYPVYLLIGKLFTFIPAGNVAYRINLMSAVFGALSLGLLYLVAQILSGQRLAALLAPLWLGVNGIFWSQAIMAEVYTTATALMVSVLLLVFLWKQSNHWFYLFAAGLLGGLGIGIHSSVLLIAPGVVLYLFLAARQWRAWLAACSGALLGSGVTLTAFILLSRITIPATYYNVGLRFAAPSLVLPPATFASELNRVFFMLFAKDLQGAVFADSSAVFLQSMGRYWDYLSDWLPVIGLSVMGVGLIGILIQHWREGLLITVGLLLSLLFVFTNNSYGLYVFCIPSYVLLALLFSAGVVTLQNSIIWLVLRFPETVPPKILEAAWLVPALFVGAAIWWAAAPVASSWQAEHITFIDSADRQNRYYQQKTLYPIDKPQQPDTEANAVLKALAPGAIVFSEWKVLYTYFYVANVEHNRFDLEIYEVCKFGESDSQAENQAIINYIQASGIEKPVYFTDSAKETCSSLVAMLGKQYSFKQVAGGRLWKLVPGDTK